MSNSYGIYVGPQVTEESSDCYVNGILALFKGYQEYGVPEETITVAIKGYTDQFRPRNATITGCNINMNDNQKPLWSIDKYE